MKNRTPAVTLASSSIYRKELLARLLKFFDQASPNIDESQLKNEDPRHYVMRLAREKARAVAHMGYEGLIIASDQCAVRLEQSAKTDSLFAPTEGMGHVMGKPGNFERAYNQLAKSSGHQVEFLTSIALLNTETDQLDIRVDRVSVKFRELTEQEIRAYLQREQPYDCAGSFKCEGLGISLFESIDSKDPNSLVGLPLIKLNAMLIDFGFNPLLMEQ